MPIDAELLICHLANSLDPCDRLPFRHDAEAALAVPGCWGDGLVHRTLVSLWQCYFHPPADTHGASLQRGGSKLTQEPPLEYGRDLRFTRKIHVNS